MTKADFIDLVREAVPRPRIDTRPLRGPLYAVAAALLLLALLQLPVTVVAIKAISVYWQMTADVEVQREPPMIPPKPRKTLLQ